MKKLLMAIITIGLFVSYLFAENCNEYLNKAKIYMNKSSFSIRTDIYFMLRARNYIELYKVCIAQNKGENNVKQCK